MTVKTVEIATTSDVEQLLVLIRDGSELLLTLDHVPLVHLIPIEMSDDFDDPPIW